MRSLYLLGLITAIFATGCQKDPYPYITKQEATQIYVGQNPSVQNVAFINNNDVYFAADIDKPATRITTTATYKKLVKMSHDHTKFAYQNGSGYIEIVDNTGKLITTLSQYTQVKSFDWTADDKTLYILNGDQMAYYGSALSLSITYPGITPGYSTEILSASVSLKGDFAYVIHYYAYIFSVDNHRVVIKPAGSSNVLTYDNNTQTYPMAYVGFSAHDQDMVVGYRDLHPSVDTYQKVEFFTNLAIFPTFSYGSSQMYGTPVYNSSLNYFVCGFLDNNTSKIALAAINTKDYTKNKVSATYTSNGNGLYTDWK